MTGRKCLWKDKIGLANKGKIPWTYGKRLSEATKEKIRTALSGRMRPEFTGMGNPFYGKKHTVEAMKKLTEANIKNARYGEKASNWKGGVTPENRRIRGTSKYINWRKEVFKRDNYTCKECGARSGVGKMVILNADHIKAFADFPELRFNLNNGRTLCLPCHKKTPTYLSNYYKKGV